MSHVAEVEILPPLASPFAMFPLERDNPMFRAGEVALWLRIPLRDLDAMRRNGDGPDFVVLRDKTIRYLLSDLNEWIAANRHRSRPAAVRPTYQDRSRKAA